MKYLPKILLIYSAIFSTIILVLGIVTSRGNSMFLMQLLFLPVVIYFIWELLHKRREEPSPLSNSSVFIALAIFAVLVATSFMSIANSKPEPEVTIEEFTSTPLIMNPNKNSSDKNTAVKPQEYVQINLDDGNSYVNIRQLPSLTSEVIDIGVDEEKFLLEEQTEDWYRIKVDGQESAYVHKDYVILVTLE